MSEADPQIPVEPVDETETVVETEAPAPKRNKRRLLLMLRCSKLLLRSLPSPIAWHIPDRPLT